MMKSTQQRRIGAFIIDTLVIGILVSLVESLFPFLYEAKTTSIFGISVTYRFGASFLFYVCYFILFDLANEGNTIGKLLFKIKVISEDEAEITKGKRMVRSLLKLVSIIVLPIAILLFLFKDYFSMQEHYTNTITVRS